jgi:hypothetical protein
MRKLFAAAGAFASSMPSRRESTMPKGRRRWSLAVGVMMTAAWLASPAAPAQAASHALTDRKDVTTAYQIHLVYAIPSDGADRGLDTNGAIATSFAAGQTWLHQQTVGKSYLRLDKYKTSTGALKPDITFFRLSETDAQVASQGAYVREEIQREMHAAGLTSTRKIYAVYYDGSSTFSRGGGAWPPTLIGNVAALYLHGAPPGAPACDTNSLATSTTRPGYLEFAMVHEIMHTLGLVPTCAPHQWRQGHVPEPNDLMYAGDVPWQLPPTLDIGHDDYYKANIAGCPDLAKSVYLTPTPAGAQPPPT